VNLRIIRQKTTYPTLGPSRPPSAQPLPERISEQRAALAKFDAELLAKRIELVEPCALLNLGAIAQTPGGRFQGEQALDQEILR
jgi:hypothetical protein